MATNYKNDEIFSDAEEHHLENATSTINTSTCTATTTTHDHHDDYNIVE